MKINYSDVLLMSRLQNFAAETALCAVLINELIQINSGPKVLRSCFFALIFNIVHARGVPRTILENVSCSRKGTWPGEPLRGGCRRQLADTTPPSQPHFLIQYNRVFITMWLRLNHVLEKIATVPFPCRYITVILAQTRPAHHMSCSPRQVLHLWHAHSHPHFFQMRRLIPA
jgi:hypothetical protein